MESVYKIVVKAHKGSSLTPLVRQLKREYPDFLDRLSSLELAEGRKPLFGAGDMVLNKLSLELTCDDPEDPDLEVFDKILEIINGSDKWELVEVRDERSNIV